jgi:hypothetical protein
LIARWTAGEERGVGAGHLPVADDLGERVTPRLLGHLRGGDHGGAAVADLAGVAGGDVAGLVERGAELAQRLGRGVAAHALVVGDDERVALALGHLTGRSRRRTTRLLGGIGARGANRGDLVLLLALEPVGSWAYFSVPSPMAHWSNAQ